MTPSNRDTAGRPGFIDFTLSRARVVADEKNPTLFILEAVDGAWKDRRGLRGAWEGGTEAYTIGRFGRCEDGSLRAWDPEKSKKGPRTASVRSLNAAWAGKRQSPHVFVSKFA